MTLKSFFLLTHRAVYTIYTIRVPSFYFLEVRTSAPALLDAVVFSVGLTNQMELFRNSL